MTGRLLLMPLLTDMHRLQADFLEKSKGLHEDAEMILKENQLLRNKVQLVDQLQVRPDEHCSISRVPAMEH
jgi:hypothetical protein